MKIFSLMSRFVNPLNQLGIRLDNLTSRVEVMEQKLLEHQESQQKMFKEIMKTMEELNEKIKNNQQTRLKL
jgi:hypothetical protein